MFVYVESSAPMARGVPDPYSLAEIAKRLKLLRKAKEKTQAIMADMAGVSPQAWGNYEQGTRRIEIDAVTRLRAATGVTSEWVYYGNINQLPADLLQQLELARREIERERRRGT